MKPEILCQVDKNDVKIRPITYEVIYQKKIRHRVVHVLIFNDKNNLLLQKRSKKKIFCPSHWSSSAQGHVRYGETYSDAAQREAFEELKIHIKPVFFLKFFYRSDMEKFIGICIARYNYKIRKSSTEISSCKFIKISEVVNFLKRKKIHPEFKIILDNFLMVRNE